MRRRRRFPRLLTKNNFRFVHFVMMYTEKEKAPTCNYNVGIWCFFFYRKEDRVSARASFDQNVCLLLAATAVLFWTLIMTTRP